MHVDFPLPICRTKPESSSQAYHGVGCYSNLGAAQSSFLYPYNKVKGDLTCIILISKVWLIPVLSTLFFLTQFTLVHLAQDFCLDET